MWDVLWTDPDKELIGERRARKEKKRGPTTRDNSLLERNSVLTMSSLSSNDSPFALLRSKQLKQHTIAKAHSQTKDSNSLPPISPVSQLPFPREYDDKDSQRSSTGIEAEAEMSLVLSNHESIFSRCRESVSTSFNSVGETIDDSTHSGTEIEILNAPSAIVGQKDPLVLSRPVAPAIGESAKNSPSYAVFQPMTPLASPFKMALDTAAPGMDLDVPILPLKSPRRPPVTLLATPELPHDVASWRRPDAWEPQVLPVKGLENGNICNYTHDDAIQRRIEDSFDLESIRKRLEQMIDATPRQILLQLREINRVEPLIGIEGIVELEKQHWILAVLHHMDSLPQREGKLQNGFQKGVENTLILHEHRETASFIAAWNDSKKFYHMAKNPLPAERFPNVEAVVATAAETSAALPLEPASFGSVHTTMLPSLFRNDEVPQILMSINHCLEAAGLLQMTLIDPLPRAETMGKNMREWLERNLLRNLKEQDRCLSPSIMFPKWLGQAHLRGRGSALTTTKFYAVPQSARNKAYDTETNATDREIKAELRSIVGRSLWTQVWGGFVTGNTWWWEDRACVEECVRLGTVWEYYLIRGVKREEECS